MKKLSSLWVDVQYNAISHEVSDGITTSNIGILDIFLYPTISHVRLKRHDAESESERERGEKEPAMFRKEKRMLNPMGNTWSESMLSMSMSVCLLPSMHCCWETSEQKFFFEPEQLNHRISSALFPISVYKIQQWIFLWVGSVCSQKPFQWKWSIAHEKMKTKKKPTNRKKSPNIDKLETIAEFLISKTQDSQTAFGHCTNWFCEKSQGDWSMLEGEYEPSTEWLSCSWDVSIVLEMCSSENGIALFRCLFD